MNKLQIENMVLLSSTFNDDIVRGILKGDRKPNDVWGAFEWCYTPEDIEFWDQAATEKTLSDKTRIHLLELRVAMLLWRGVVGSVTELEKELKP